MFRNSTVRFLILAIFICAAAVTGWSQDVEVDRDELQSIGDQSIRFINYVGPYEFTNTLDQIRGIGRSLADSIDPGSSGTAAIGDKYRVLHIVTPEIEEGFDADIFILGADARVDHINNLRTIIAGYLENTYGFSGRDAFLVAEFITYYNAVYRGDMEMAAERYKQPVVDALEPAKMGLDTHFSNWAGQTMMVIPLRGGTRGPKIDTGAITDDEVIEEMREEEDMGLESRKDMVEFREEEIDEEQKELDERRDEVEEKEEAIEEELAEIEEKEESGRELTVEEEQRKEELEEEKAVVEEEKRDIEEQQKDLDERTEDTLEMRDEIAEDENRMMEERQSEDTFTSAVTVTPVWFLMVDDEGDGIPFGRVVMYDLESGRRMAVSNITAVRGRSMAILPESLLVIAGKEDGNSKVRLMLLDQETLEVDREGTHDVFPGSILTLRGSDIYLVTSETGEWRLGRFDTNLGRTAVSEVAVEPWTSLFFEGSSLYVQGDGGEVLKLNASTLKEEARLE